MYLLKRLTINKIVKIKSFVLVLINTDVISCNIVSLIIVYVIKSLKHGYLNGFIRYINKSVPEHSILASVSMIGTLNRYLKKNETYESPYLKYNSCDAFNSYLKCKGSLIAVEHIGDKKYYHTFEKVYKTELETESPI